MAAETQQLPCLAHIFVLEAIAIRGTMAIREVMATQEAIIGAEAEEAEEEGVEVEATG